MKLLHRIRKHSDGAATKDSTDLLPQNYMQENKIMCKTCICIILQALRKHEFVLLN